MNRLSDYYARNRKWMLYALASAFVWGMLAHGYAFFSHSFSHDSLNEFNAAVRGSQIKMGSGRIFAPLYRGLFRTDITIPWLIGVLALVWAGATVYLLVQLFDIRSRAMIFLTAGILTTNISVSATAATYIHDLDCYLFAAMLAAAAVLLWRKYEKGWIWGSVPLAVCMGIYQSYLFTAVTLVIFVCVLDLLDCASFETVMANGIKAVAMIFLGGALYFVVMKAWLLLAGTPLSSGQYQSLGTILEIQPKEIPVLIFGTYRNSIRRWWTAHSGYPSWVVKGITVCVFVISLIAGLAGLRRKEISGKSKVLCAALICLLPLAMNMTYVLTRGIVHDLMVYALWLIYLLALLLSDKLKSYLPEKVAFVKLQRRICMLAVLVLLYGNVQFANGLYMKKDLEYDAYLSLMTRVVDRMENCEEYVPGSTTVVFVGVPSQTGVLNLVIPGFEEHSDVTGNWKGDVIMTPERSRYQAYFDYVMGETIKLAEEDIWKRISESDFAAGLPSYPDKGCMAFCDGVLVIKFG